MEPLADSYTNGIFFAILVLIFVIYISYPPWFNPKKWRKQTHRHRANVRLNWPLLPMNVVYRLLRIYPEFDLLLARIGSLIMIILLIGIITVLCMSLLEVQKF